MVTETPGASETLIPTLLPMRPVLCAPWKREGVLGRLRDSGQEALATLKTLDQPFIVLEGEFGSVCCKS